MNIPEGHRDIGFMNDGGSDPGPEVFPRARDIPVRPPQRFPNVYIERLIYR
jgi:hypothetical protein